MFLEFLQINIEMSIIKILSGKNSRQVAILYTSTIGGVLLGVLSSVINTRFLDPINYGDVRYVQNIINLFSCVFLLGFFVSGSRLLAVSENKENACRLKGVMVIFLLVTIAALMLLVLICYFYHIIFRNNFNSALFLYSIPVCAQPLMLNYINTTAQGDNQIGLIALARLLPAALYVLIAYFIYTSFGASSDLMILLQWGIACLVFVFIIASTKPHFNEFSKYKSILCDENKRYGMYLYWGSLAMVATQYLPGITLSFFDANNANVAYFTLALTISTPLSMLPSIVGTSYFKRFAVQKKISSTVFRVTIIITILSLVIFIILIQEIVDILYPVTYSAVGFYASLLAVGKCIHGLGDMINRFLGAHGLGKEIRNASFSCGIFIVFGSIVLVYFYGVHGAVYTSVISSVSYTCTLVVYYYRFIKMKNE